MEDILAESLAKALQNGTLAIGVMFVVERFKPVIKALLRGYDKAFSTLALTITAVAVGLLGNGFAYGFEEAILLEGAIVGFLATGGYFMGNNKYKDFLAAIEARAGKE